VLTSVGIDNSWYKYLRNTPYWQ